MEEINVVAPQMLYSRSRIIGPPSPAMIPVDQTKRISNLSANFKSDTAASLADETSDENTALNATIPRPRSTFQPTSNIKILDPTPEAHYDPSQIDSSDCTICLEGYEDNVLIRKTPCHHVFHKECLEGWLTQYRSRCPLCQKDLKPKAEVVPLGSARIATPT